MVIKVQLSAEVRATWAFGRSEVPRNAIFWTVDEVEQAKPQWQTAGRRNRRTRIKGPSLHYANLRCAFCGGWAQWALYEAPTRERPGLLLTGIATCDGCRPLGEERLRQKYDSKRLRRASWVRVRPLLRCLLPDCSGRPAFLRDKPLTVHVPTSDELDVATDDEAELLMGRVRWQVEQRLTEAIAKATGRTFRITKEVF